MSQAVCVCTCSFIAIHDYKMTSVQPKLLMAKGFSCNPLQTISIDRTFRAFLGDRQTELRLAGQVTAVYKYNPVAVGIAAVFLEHARVVTFRQQPELARKSKNRVFPGAENSMRLFSTSYSAEVSAYEIVQSQTRARTAGICL